MNKNTIEQLYINAADLKAVKSLALNKKNNGCSVYYFYRYFSRHSFILLDKVILLVQEGFAFYNAKLCCCYFI